MATATFDRTFVVEDLEDQERLLKLLNSDSPQMVHAKPPYSQEERKRSEELLRQCLSRSKY